MTEADAASTRRATRAVAGRLVGSVALLTAASEKCTLLAAQAEIVLSASKRPDDVEMVAQASKASQDLTTAVEGLRKAAKDAYGYLAETL